MERKTIDRLKNYSYRTTSYITAVLLLSIIYYSTARFGLSLHAVSRFASLVWVPSGIAVFSLLFFGFQYWPGIFIGAFFANFATGAPLLSAAGIGIGNTLEAVISVFLLAVNGNKKSFNHLRDVLVLIMEAAPIGSSISSVIGVLCLTAENTITPHAFLSTVQAWWVGDFISIILLTPLFISWTRLPAVKRPLYAFGEIVVFSFFTVLAGMYAFFGLFNQGRETIAATYIIYPPLIYAALRFGQRGATTALAAFAVMAISGTLHGTGPFVMLEPGNNLLMLQNFIGITAITILILAAVTTERLESENVKNEFISMASHELKTPVTSLKAFTQIIQKKVSGRQDKQIQAMLSTMELQINKLTNLVNDLLNLSKIQTGELAYHDGWFDIYKLVSEAAKTVQLTTASCTITIRGKVKKKIYGDKDRIGQVVINLLTNALKFSGDEKKIIITVSESGSKTIVSVQDFGIGISKNHRHKIFERFYRITKKGMRPMPGGLGIGLYISQVIIKRHGGKLWLVSKSGEGSTFSFSLPGQQHRNIRRKWVFPFIQGF